MASLFPAYAKVSDVSDVVSSVPTTPTFMPGTVPPAYFTCQPSAAIAGKQRSRIKANAINFLTLHLLRYQSVQRKGYPPTGQASLGRFLKCHMKGSLLRVHNDSMGWRMN